jgi:hypothetical protein
VFSSAAVFGMLVDLYLCTSFPETNLVSTKRYSTAYAHLSILYFISTCTLINHVVNRTAAFYWGYLIGVLPIALLLRRLPVVKTLSCFILVRMPIRHLYHSGCRLLTTPFITIRSEAYWPWRPPGSRRTRVPSNYVLPQPGRNLLISWLRTQ